MADYQAMATKLIFKLGGRDDIGPTTSTTSKVYDFLFRGMVELAHRLKKRGIRLRTLEKRNTFTMVASDGDMTYLEIETSGRLYAVLSAVNVTDGRKLHFSAPEAFEKRRINNVSDSPPTHWSSFEGIFSVTPTPEVNTSIRALTYLDPLPIATVGQDPESDLAFEEGLLLLSSMHGWRDLGENEMAAKAEQDYEIWRERNTSPEEHERGNTRTRGHRPHPSRLTNSNLGI